MLQFGLRLARGRGRCHHHAAADPLIKRLISDPATA